MVTKWKNKILLFTWVMLLTFGLSGLLTTLADRNEFFRDNYFSTQQFEGDYYQFIDGLTRFELNYKAPEVLKREIVVTKEEIEEHRNRYGSLNAQLTNIKAQYEGKIQEAKNNGNQQAIDVYIAERDMKLEDITNNFKSDEYVKPKVVKEKEQQIEQYFAELETQRPEFEKQKVDFKYYLVDVATGEVFTNLGHITESQAEQLLNDQDTLFLRQYPYKKNSYLQTSGSNEDYTNPMRNFKGRIGILKPGAGKGTGLLISNYYDYQQSQKLFFVQTILALLALITCFYLNKKFVLIPIQVDDTWKRYYNKIPIDIAAFALALTSFFITLTLISQDNQIYVVPYLYPFLKATLISNIVSAFFLVLTLVQAQLLYIRVRETAHLQTEWKAALSYRTVQAVRMAFLIRSTGKKVAIILILSFAFGVGAVVVAIEPVLVLVYVPAFILLGLPLLILTIKSTGYFNHIVTNTNQIVEGKLDQDLIIKGKSQLATLANNINKLKHGVKVSRREQAKSERLKTELITNVSHDLRTPLTSIITYTELLKKPDLVETDREAYIQIIDRKAKRLKVLIDDLFEASKMASGNIELIRTKVDLVQLLQQALAEHNEQVATSTLQFRVTNPDLPVYVNVDGQKLWRVFDNLIGNILKYALENTRVYITVEEQEGQASITFKNVTKYELGQEVDELFDRFKRGDTSRHTEGSGLGLAIAKSIIDLHGGNMEIEVDGDLFKVKLNMLLLATSSLENF